MPSKKHVPPEWSALPGWVKDEMVDGPLLKDGYRMFQAECKQHGTGLSLSHAPPSCHPTS